MIPSATLKNKDFSVNPARRRPQLSASTRYLVNFARDETSGSRRAATGWALLAVLVANELRGALVAVHLGSEWGLW